MEAYLTGIFPRSEALIAATRGFDRGRVSREEMAEVFRHDVREAVELQRGAGFNLLSDGLLNWQDLFRPLVEAWGGLTLGGLTRWYDNNTFFRQPAITSSLEPGPLPREYLRVDLIPRGARVKAVLPGPYTIYDLAEDRHYANPVEAVPDLGKCLRRVCDGLRELGCAHVQFSEPSLLEHPPSQDILETVRQAYETLRGADGMEISLQLYFASVQPQLGEILNFPVDILGLDLYEEDLGRLVDVDFDKILACGCIDARNSLLETPGEIASLVEGARESLSPPGTILCPNADLEFLPRSVAADKVRALGEARDLLEEAG